MNFSTFLEIAMRVFQEGEGMTRGAAFLRASNLWSSGTEAATTKILAMEAVAQREKAGRLAHQNVVIARALAAPRPRLFKKKVAVMRAPPRRELRTRTRK